MSEREELNNRVEHLLNRLTQCFSVVVGRLWVNFFDVEADCYKQSKVPTIAYYHASGIHPEQHLLPLGALINEVVAANFRLLALAHEGGFWTAQTEEESWPNEDDDGEEGGSEVPQPHPELAKRVDAFQRIFFALSALQIPHAVFDAAADVPEILAFLNLMDESETAYEDLVQLEQRCPDLALTETQRLALQEDAKSSGIYRETVLSSDRPSQRRMEEPPVPSWTRDKHHVVPAKRIPPMVKQFAEGHVPQGVTDKKGKFVTGLFWDFETLLPKEKEMGLGGLVTRNVQSFFVEMINVLTSQFFVHAQARVDGTVYLTPTTVKVETSLVDKISELNLKTINKTKIVDAMNKDMKQLMDTKLSDGEPFKLVLITSGGDDFADTLCYASKRRVPICVISGADPGSSGDRLVRFWSNERVIHISECVGDEYQTLLMRVGMGVDDDAAQRYEAEADDARRVFADSRRAAREDDWNPTDAPVAGGQHLMAAGGGDFEVGEFADALAATGRSDLVEKKQQPHFPAPAARAPHAPLSGSERVIVQLRTRQLHFMAERSLCLIPGKDYVMVESNNARGEDLGRVLASESGGGIRVDGRGVSEKRTTKDLTIPTDLTWSDDPNDQVARVTRRASEKEFKRFWSMFQDEQDAVLELNESLSLDVTFDKKALPVVEAVSYDFDMGRLNVFVASESTIKNSEFAKEASNILRLTTKPFVYVQKRNPKRSEYWACVGRTNDYQEDDRFPYDSFPTAAQLQQYKEKKQRPAAELSLSSPATPSSTGKQQQQPASPELGTPNIFPMTNVPDLTIPNKVTERDCALVEDLVIGKYKGDAQIEEVSRALERHDQERYAKKEFRKAVINTVGTNPKGLLECYSPEPPSQGKQVKTFWIRQKPGTDAQARKRERLAIDASLVEMVIAGSPWQFAYSPHRPVKIDEKFYKTLLPKLQCTYSTRDQKKNLIADALLSSDGRMTKTTDEGTSYLQLVPRGGAVSSQASSPSSAPTAGGPTYTAAPTANDTLFDIITPTDSLPSPKQMEDYHYQAQTLYQVVVEEGSARRDSGLMPAELGDLGAVEIGSELWTNLSRRTDSVPKGRREREVLVAVALKNYQQRGLMCLALPRPPQAGGGRGVYLCSRDNSVKKHALLAAEVKKNQYGVTEEQMDRVNRATGVEQPTAGASVELAAPQHMNFGDSQQARAPTRIASKSASALVGQMRRTSASVGGVERKSPGDSPTVGSPGVLPKPIRRAAQGVAVAAPIVVQEEEVGDEFEAEEEEELELDEDEEFESDLHRILRDPKHPFDPLFEMDIRTLECFILRHRANAKTKSVDLTDHTAVKGALKYLNYNYLKNHERRADLIQAMVERPGARIQEEVIKKGKHIKGKKLEPITKTKLSAIHGKNYWGCLMVRPATTSATLLGRSRMPSVLPDHNAVFPPLVNPRVVAQREYWLKAIVQDRNVQAQALLGSSLNSKLVTRGILSLLSHLVCTGVESRAATPAVATAGGGAGGARSGPTRRAAFTWTALLMNLVALCRLPKPPRRSGKANKSAGVNPTATGSAFPMHLPGAPELLDLVAALVRQSMSRSNAAQPFDLLQEVHDHIVADYFSHATPELVSLEYHEPDFGWKPLPSNGHSVTATSEAEAPAPTAGGGSSGVSFALARTTTTQVYLPIHPSIDIGAMQVSIGASPADREKFVTLMSKDERGPSDSNEDGNRAVKQRSECYYAIPDYGDPMAYIEDSHAMPLYCRFENSPSHEKREFLNTFPVPEATGLRIQPEPVHSTASSSARLEVQDTTATNGGPGTASANEWGYSDGKGDTKADVKSDSKKFFDYNERRLQRRADRLRALERRRLEEMRREMMSHFTAWTLADHDSNQATNPLYVMPAGLNHLPGSTHLVATKPQWMEHVLAILQKVGFAVRRDKPVVIRTAIFSSAENLEVAAWAVDLPSDSDATKDMLEAMTAGREMVALYRDPAAGPKVAEPFWALHRRDPDATVRRRRENVWEPSPRRVVDQRCGWEKLASAVVAYTSGRIQDEYLQSNIIGIVELYWTEPGARPTLEESHVAQVEDSIRQVLGALNGSGFDASPLPYWRDDPEASGSVRLLALTSERFRFGEEEMKPLNNKNPVPHLSPSITTIIHCDARLVHRMRDVQRSPGKYLKQQPLYFSSLHLFNLHKTVAEKFLSMLKQMTNRQKVKEAIKETKGNWDLIPLYVTGGPNQLNDEDVKYCGKNHKKKGMDKMTQPVLDDHKMFLDKVLPDYTIPAPPVVVAKPPVPVVVATPRVAPPTAGGGGGPVRQASGSSSKFSAEILANVPPTAAGLAILSREGTTDLDKWNKIQGKLRAVPEGQPPCSAKVREMLQWLHHLMLDFPNGDFIVLCFPRTMVTIKTMLKEFGFNTYHSEKFSKSQVGRPHITGFVVNGPKWMDNVDAKAMLTMAESVDGSFMISRRQLPDEFTTALLDCVVIPPLIPEATRFRLQNHLVPCDADEPYAAYFAVGGKWGQGGCPENAVAFFFPSPYAFDSILIKETLEEAVAIKLETTIHKCPGFALTMGGPTFDTSIGHSFHTVTVDRMKGAVTGALLKQLDGMTVYIPFDVSKPDQKMIAGQFLVPQIRGVSSAAAASHQLMKDDDDMDEVKRSFAGVWNDLGRTTTGPGDTRYELSVRAKKYHHLKFEEEVHYFYAGAEEQVIRYFESASEYLDKVILAAPVAGGAAHPTSDELETRLRKAVLATWVDFEVDLNSRLVAMRQSLESLGCVIKETPGGRANWATSVPADVATLMKQMVPRPPTFIEAPTAGGGERVPDAPIAELVPAFSETDLAEMLEVSKQAKEPTATPGLQAQIKALRVASSEGAEVDGASTWSEWRAVANSLMKEKIFSAGCTAMYTKAIQLLPASASPRDRATLLSNLSMAHTKCDQMELAVERANEAIAADPMWFKGYFRNFDALRLMGQILQAEAAFQLTLTKCATEEERDSVLGPYGDQFVGGARGATFYLKKTYSSMLFFPQKPVVSEADKIEAMSNVDHAVRLDPENPHTHLIRARIYMGVAQRSGANVNESKAKMIEGRESYSAAFNLWQSMPRSANDDERSKIASVLDKWVPHSRDAAVYHCEQSANALLVKKFGLAIDEALMAVLMAHEGPYHMANLRLRNAVKANEKLGGGEVQVQISYTTTFAEGRALCKSSAEKEEFQNAADACDAWILNGGQMGGAATTASMTSHSTALASDSIEQSPPSGQPAFDKDQMTELRTKSTQQYKEPVPSLALITQISNLKKGFGFSSGSPSAEWKEVATGFYKENIYSIAAVLYETATKLLAKTAAPRDRAALHSNRSACLLEMSELRDALAEALASVKADSSWYKAHFRVMAVYSAMARLPVADLRDRERALAAYNNAMERCSSDSERDFVRKDYGYLDPTAEASDEEWEEEEEEEEDEDSDDSGPPTLEPTRRGEFKEQSRDESSGEWGSSSSSDGPPPLATVRTSGGRNATSGSSSRAHVVQGTQGESRAMFDENEMQRFQRYDKEREQEEKNKKKKDEDEKKRKRR